MMLFFKYMRNDCSRLAELTEIIQVYAEKIMFVL